MRTTRTASWIWGIALLVACGGAPKPAPAPPPPPTPPSDPMAWMPEDARLLLHVVAPAFRGTPIWELWTSFQQKRRELQFWFDPELVDELTLAATELETEQPKFVAVVRGRFGAGYLDGLAARDHVALEQRGLLRVYARPEGVFSQLSPELILVASSARADWVVARAAQGPGTPVEDGPLFRSLASRVGFGQAELALLLEDPEGKGKQRLEHDSASLGVGLPDAVMAELARAGISVDMGSAEGRVPSAVALAAVVESQSAEGAASIRQATERSLESLASNMFVGMFGLRPFVDAIAVGSEGSYVSVRAQYAQADLFALIGKLKNVLGMARAQGGVAAPAASQP
jgi:hypothetical protein